MGFPSGVVGKGNAKESKVVCLRNRTVINVDYMIMVSGIR